MQKLAALFLSAALLFSLIVPAWADEPVPADDPDSAQTEPVEDIHDAALEGDPNSVPPESVTEGTPAPEEDETPEDPADGAVTEGENTAEETPVAPEEVPAFSDVQGHWAEATLEWAYENGLLQGFEDGTMRPDATINQAEMLAILTRLLDAQDVTNQTNFNFKGGEWYADVANKGSDLRLYDGTIALEDSMPRWQAFRMLATAFQLRDTAELPDLSAYTDVLFLSSKEQREIGYLLRAGYVEGHGGLLAPFAPLSRAEFVTILKRIVPNLSAESDALPQTGGSLLTGEVALKDQTITAPLWIDCAATSLSFENVNAASVAVWAQDLDKISFTGKNHIETLTIAGGNGEDLDLTIPANTTINRLILGNHHGGLTIASGKVDTVIDSVGYRALTIAKNAKVQNLTLLGDNCKLTLESDITQMDVYAPVTLTEGKIGTLTLYCEAEIAGTVEVGETVNKIDTGLTDSTYSIDVVKTLPVGAELTYSVTISNPTERVVWLNWDKDGIKHTMERVTIGPAAKTFTYTFPVEYSKDMATETTLKCYFLYEDFLGNVSAIHLPTTVTLENHPADYYDQHSVEKVLARVKTGYIGDYTTAWAEANDYDETTKNVWINAKGYSSSTQYLIWINTTYQRVNIFEGSQGDWTLIRSNLCGTGRNGHNTPVGVYTVGTRTEGGWTTGSYHVCPVVRFKQGSGLAFHSRKYNAPNHKVMIDASIGFPVSLGCIRMYDEDVWWIYDNIPQGTTVVVY